MHIISASTTILRSFSEQLTPSLPQPVKFLGWKVHVSAWKQYISQSYNKPIFNSVGFDENPFTC